MGHQDFYLRCRMRKFAGSMAFAFFVLILAAAIAIFLISLAEAQSVTGKQWAVVFKFKAPKNSLLPPPEIRINLLVDGDTEGEAAINANKQIGELLTIEAQERLQFIEAQQKR